MKGKLKKTLCLLCVLTLLLASSAFATDVERERAPDAGGFGQEESGLFILTGLESVPGNESVEETESLPSFMGNDAQSSEETVSTSDEIPSDSGAALLDGATLSAAPTLTLSNTQISRKVGETGSVTVRVSGYPSGAYLEASNSNSQAFSCVWGDWYGDSIPIRITGKKQGGGTLTVSLKNASHQVLISSTVRVTMVADNPTLSFSPASVSMPAGGSKSATLTLQNYSGSGSVSASVANRSVCDVQWGNWSGKSVPITVTGKAAGNTKITVRLYNSAQTELTSVTLSVEVTASASLSVSSSSLSVNAGESATLTATAAGALSNGDCFKYTVSDSSVFGVTPGGSAGKSAKLTVTGKKAGSGTLTVTLSSQSGTVLDRKTVSVQVAAKPSNQRVSVSSTSVTARVGSSVRVNCTGQNVNGTFSLRYTNHASSVLRCAWGESWSGNTLPLTITGQAAGTGSVTVSLLVGGVVRSTATIQVKVEGGGGGESGVQSPSYSFGNYSKPGISLALCQYMFGNNQRARTVYNYDVGNGGVCFGISATSGMLSSPNTPSPDAFSKTSMRDLQKSNYSNTLSMSLSDFIEAMHIAQVSNMMREESGISNMVNAVRNGGTSQPVIICMRGRDGGHAILAYGVTASGSLRVYDSNYPLQERVLNISGNNWSYNISSNTIWNQNNARIAYIPYATYAGVWRSRGNLNGVLFAGDETKLSRYLLATTADDFSLMVFDEYSQNYEREIAAYENGVLIRHDDTVEEAFVSNIPLDAGSYTSPHMLYVPGEDLYTVHNRSGNMDVTLSGSNLSVRVNAEAEKFDLAVSDTEEFACAMLNGLEEGKHYSISLGTSAPGQPDETTIEGDGNGQSICLGYGKFGDLGFGMDGVYVSGGDNGAMLSVGDMDGESDSPFKMDFTLNAVNYDTEYPLTAEAGEGGIILQSPDSHRSVTSVLEGGSYTYRVQPQEGYTLKAVYVNGVEAAYAQSESGQPSYTYYNGAYEYTFRDVREPGYLYAEFAKDISACQVRGDYDAGHPTVTVTDGDKVLSEGVDYEWSVSRVEENGSQKMYLVVHALSGGAYSGVSLTAYDFHVDIEGPALIPGTYDPESKEISLTAKNTDNPVIVAAAYDGNGKMLAFLPTIRTLAKTADGIPVRISPNAAGLPKSYVVRVFLLGDMDAMRPLCDPIEIPVLET